MNYNLKEYARKSLRALATKWSRNKGFGTIQRLRNPLVAPYVETNLNFPHLVLPGPITIGTIRPGLEGSVDVGDTSLCMTYKHCIVHDASTQYEASEMNIFQAMRIMIVGFTCESARRYSLEEQGIKDKLGPDRKCFHSIHDHINAYSDSSSSISVSSMTSTRSPSSTPPWSFPCPSCFSHMFARN